MNANYNLEKKIDEFLTRKEAELAKKRRSQERSEAWEKNKPAFFNTLKFFGATALLAGALYLGTTFVNSLPGPDISARKARREQKIENLQADSTRYENNIADLQLINNSLAEQNERLNSIVAHEKSRRNIFGNVKKSEQRASAKTVVSQPRTGGNVVDFDEVIRTRQSGSSSSQTYVGPAREESASQQRTTTSQTPRQEQTQVRPTRTITRHLSGYGPEETLVRMWKNGQVYEQSSIKNGEYNIPFPIQVNDVFFVDSVTAEHPNYKRKSHNFEHQPLNKDMELNFNLERIEVTRRTQESELENIVEPTFRERRGKLYLEQAQQPYTHSLIVNRGEIVVIPAGTIITGENTFRIIVDGGTLEIKGRSNNPVRINARENWQGITYISSTDNIIEYCEIVNARSVNNHAGGAITMINSELSIANSTLKNNSSGGDGGTIRAKRSKLEIKNSTLDAGRASGNGGNIYVLDTKIDIINSQILNGTARNGGNIYAQNSEGSTQQGLLNYPLFIKKSIINYGTASEQGGGIAIIQTLIETQQTTGTANKAQYGGAIHGDRGIYNFVRESYFRRNEATISGGGAYLEGIEVVDDGLRKAFQNNSRNNVVIK